MPTAVLPSGNACAVIVPTLCVGIPHWTLCVRFWDAERPWLHSHAERGNDHDLNKHKKRHSPCNRKPSPGRRRWRRPAASVFSSWSCCSSPW
ncbi:hypothetical protein F6476_23325 [Pseudomonas umsongensis]|uniref:Secreted protein n=1 Tax=Pseudomonas umsongensis TaxID=198618 RepID=A0ABX4DRD7_9PSED|nr:hypothetical protein PSUM_23685 [Pseudomonas umsongensis]QFG31893.1 hypothetical protein F6476_23325 [Pseudomonas umsongensis]